MCWHRRARDLGDPTKHQSTEPVQPLDGPPPAGDPGPVPGPAGKEREIDAASSLLAKLSQLARFGLAGRDRPILDSQRETD